MSTNKPPTKMFITIKIMPESPEVDLEHLKNHIKEVADAFEASMNPKTEIEPVAFGLEALKVTLLLDETKGSEELCEEIAKIHGVSSAEVIDMRRLIS
ncbi:MAG TPA: elongation factor 1-beta [Candidatus Nanoarchaeia archaeon]|nr:elongation factor 1-beta [Candidatus Nanoarchaeia archaeon]